MYLDRIRFQNFRTFRDASIDLVHPTQDFSALEIPKPKLTNLNLLLGNNGLGKSTFLKGVALAALGPAVEDAGIFPYQLVRRDAAAAKKRTRRLPKGSAPWGWAADARVVARFRPNPQDDPSGDAIAIDSDIGVQARGDLERLVWLGSDQGIWSPIYQSESDAFFFVGYGASRHVEPKERFDPGLRKSNLFVRAQRVQGLFQESYPLVPLSAWLRNHKSHKQSRFAEIKDLINRIMGPGHYQFTGDIEQGECIFLRRKMRVPFPALSDGYRAFLGWLGDLLYHLVSICPQNKKLVDQCGIVMVDEIDLHLHPKWQLTVLPLLARTLPNLQFLITSHSPLLVGSLEWMNIVVMKPGRGESSSPCRVEAPVHGLDADQVLLTEFFGMETTRAAGKERRLKNLTMKARGGDLQAAKALMEQLSRGMEKSA